MIEYQYLYRKNFASFCEFSFRILNPGERMQPCWHAPLMANILEFSWLENDTDLYRKLIFNLPPDSLKTHICSISLPAWILGRDPRKNVLIVSETPQHARTIQAKCEELMDSVRYKAIFPRTRIKRVARDIELAHGGRISHAGIGYSLPQGGSDLVVIDNPESLHRKEKKSYGSLLEIGRLLRKQNEGLMILATRRLGREDMSQFLYQNGGWAVISLPAVAMEEKRWLFPPYDDTTQEPGDLLQWRNSWDDLEARLYDLGGEAFAYQYLQGEYVPNNQHCGNVGVDQDGKMVFFAGKPSLTTVAAKHLGRLRGEYQDRMKEIEKMLGSVPRPPDVKARGSKERKKSRR